MKLRAYIEKKKLTHRAFAAMVDIPEWTLERYLAGRVPRPDIMVRIYFATGCKVQPNDFYILSAQ